MNAILDTQIRNTRYDILTTNKLGETAYNVLEILY